ncbi:glycosyltransferase family 2 protein [Listeria fleischmannii]|uniref:glycosyltransferase family 2 protein n=1 Tax=Listeria fleischmannii TaxID=1069827 RepID=UPI001627B71B|nr:glycosyltransferase family 2 protein [Listeria fleischmannii]MBC1418258.1 glycosyltransferase family 2 protein [Listeria fleischmannii]
MKKTVIYNLAFLLLFFGIFLLMSRILTGTIVGTDIFGKHIEMATDLSNSFYKIFLFSLFGLITFDILAVCYYVSLSFWGLVGAKKYPDQKPMHKFHIIIPAKDEGEVIEQTVQTLAELNYPSELYTITVIADNCEDDTVQRLQNYPIFIFENKSERNAPRGKPHALRSYFSNCKEWMDADYLIILDADNIMHPDYLYQMNNQFIAMPELVCSQGYLGSKNVTSSFLASGYSASYFHANRIYQLAKAKLGWNTTIGGTGFALSTDYIIKHGWNPRSYTEDFELQTELAISGKKTSWNHHAIIYDEKPNSLRVSTKQRTRWAQGHWFVAFSSILVQFFTLIRSKSLRELNSRIENIFYSFSMLSPLLGLIITISALIFKSEYNYVLPIWDLVLLWILLDSYRFIVLPIFTIFNELPKNFQSKKTNRFKLFFQLWIGMYYASITYIYPQIIGFFTCMRKQNKWVKTKHSVKYQEGH